MAIDAQPRLAVILHADVVGSTALVRHDERAAHAHIQAVFHDLDAQVARHGGTVNEIRGDALVAEFARVSDAVLAALAAQDANRERVARQQDVVAPVLRIGIALGEVVVADATVTGAGVVLAQRLEQLAEPGGVCVSGAAREATPDRLALRFESLGAREFKGFDEPVSAYAVSLPPGAPVPAPQPAETARPAARPRRWLAAGLVALALLVAGLAVWLEPWSPTPAPAGPPSIAVLAFSNMSNDAEQDYFADGIAEDIITDLSKIPELLVIARNSSFSYKGKDVPIGTIARELGVEYVLEGSVRRAGDAVRINAQLIHAGSDGHLWAERYDGSLEDIFALQDRITKQIVTALSIRLSPESERDLARAETVVPEAYDAYLRGMRHINVRSTYDSEHIAGAREAFQEAVDLDPGFARAHAGLGWAYWNDFAYLNPLDRSLKVRTFELAEKSLSLSDNALARRLRAKQFFAPEIFGYFGNRPKQPAEAISELRRAVELEPTNADALAELAYTLVFAGEPAEAAELMTRARRLNPNFPAWYHRPTGIAQYLSGSYAHAVREFRGWYASESLANESIPWLAAALAQEGDTASAREVIGELASSLGAFVWHQQYLANRYVFVRDRDRAHFMEGLGKAGVPSAP